MPMSYSLKPENTTGYSQMSPGGMQGMGVSPYGGAPAPMEEEDDGGNFNVYRSLLRPGLRGMGLGMLLGGGGFGVGGVGNDFVSQSGRLVGGGLGGILGNAMRNKFGRPSEEDFMGMGMGGY